MVGFYGEKLDEFHAALTTSYHNQFQKNSGALNRLLFEDHRSDPRSKPVDRVFPLADFKTLFSSPCPQLCSWICGFKMFQEHAAVPHLTASKESSAMITSTICL